MIDQRHTHVARAPPRLPPSDEAVKARTQRGWPNLAKPPLIPVEEFQRARQWRAVRPASRDARCPDRLGATVEGAAWAIAPSSAPRPQDHSSSQGPCRCAVDEPSTSMPSDAVLCTTAEQVCPKSAREGWVTLSSSTSSVVARGTLDAASRLASCRAAASSSSRSLTVFNRKPDPVLASRAHGQSCSASTKFWIQLSVARAAKLGHVNPNVVNPKIISSIAHKRSVRRRRWRWLRTSQQAPTLSRNNYSSRDCE